ncbi:MAG: hypothetical protein AAFY71_16625 [Bacteroidota bacterium]
MTAKPISTWTPEEFQTFMDSGGKIVTYTFQLGCIFFTYDWESKPYVVATKQEAIGLGLWPAIFCILLGWWGGSIFSNLGFIRDNLGGGEDLTHIYLEESINRDPRAQAGLL